MPWILHAVLHATVIAVIAFFILFAASKAEGFVALLGRLLGYWVLVIAVVGLGCGIYFGMSGKPPFPPGGHPGWMHHWGPPMMQTPPAAPTTPAPPAKP